MSKLTSDQALASFNRIINAIDILLARGSYKIEEINETNLEIEQLVEKAFYDWNDRIKKYNQRIRAKDFFSNIKKSNDEILVHLRLMRKTVSEYVDELSYQMAVKDQKNRTKFHNITVSKCVSSDNSFEVHITGKGFPPDTITITKVMFPDFSSIGSIGFKTDNYGNLSSFLVMQ